MQLVRGCGARCRRTRGDGRLLDGLWGPPRHGHFAGRCRHWCRRSARGIESVRTSRRHALVVSALRICLLFALLQMSSCGPGHPVTVRVFSQLVLDQMVEMRIPRGHKNFLVLGLPMERGRSEAKTESGVLRISTKEGQLVLSQRFTAGEAGRTYWLDKEGLESRVLTSGTGQWLDLDDSIPAGQKVRVQVLFDSQPSEGSSVWLFFLATGGGRVELSPISVSPGQ